MNPQNFFLLFILITSTESSESFSNSSCSSNPCIKGVCTEDTFGQETPKFKCFCLEGYTGVHCDVLYDQCLQGRNKCQNNGTCVNKIQGNSSSISQCLCQPGFCGRFCEVEIDDCVSGPCLNGGMCFDRHLGFNCLCPPGYSGDRCEVDVDACSEDFLLTDRKFLNITRHCENGGLCIDGPGEEYSCRCGRGYTGSRCEVKVDYCVSDPCLNGGRCESVQGTFSCLCPYGWSGLVCDRKLRPCSQPESCLNRALCMEEDFPEDSSKNPNIFCFCAPDFHGPRCEHKYDECTPNGCQNSGVCIDGVNGFTCNCSEGFSGPRCEVNCKENPEFCIETTTISTTSTTTDSTTSATTTISTLPETTPTETPVIIPVTPEPTLQPTSTTSTSANQLDPKISKIFSSRFNTPSSFLTFKVRRLKRQTSTLQFDLVISSLESTNGKILYANSSSATKTTYHLDLEVQESQLKGKIWSNDSSEPILKIENSYPLEPEIRYTVLLSLTSLEDKESLPDSQNQKKSVIAELQILNSQNQELLSSTSARASRTSPLTSVPCFESYTFGASTGSSSFKGCLQKILLNGEEKYPKDALQGVEILECETGNVCKETGQNPCQNNGTCLEDEETSSWSCKCPQGFGGWLCEEAKCEEGFCKHGGLCLLTGSGEGEPNLKNFQNLLHHHLCVCTAGFKGPRCEEKVNLTFPLFNIGPSSTSSFLKYRLPFDLREFFEIRFRFIAHQIGQKSALLMFMSGSSSIKKSSNSTTETYPTISPTSTTSTFSSSDFITLLYSQRKVLLRLNLGQGERTLVYPTEANVTEQMVLFGRYHQTFWLLVVPAVSSINPKLSPQVGRMPLHHRILNVDPILWVGGHEDFGVHPALAGLTGFKGCIYDLDLRPSGPSANFTRIDESLVEKLSGVQQCDFECT